MKRTKGLLKRKKPPVKKDRWYLGMNYLPNKFGTVKGPFKSLFKVLNVRSTPHHCILLKRESDWYLTHRKNSGEWKEIEKGWKKIEMGHSSQNIKRTKRKKRKMKRSK